MAVQSIFFSISSLTILQTHSFVINKFVFQALYLKLQEREMNFWKVFRLTTFQNLIYGDQLKPFDVVQNEIMDSHKLAHHFDRTVTQFYLFFGILQEKIWNLFLWKLFDL